MAFNSTDWTIDYGAKTVVNNDSGIGTNLPSNLGNYSKVGTVLEFFQWLAAEFASSSQMDDDYAFVSDTPTVYRWVNDWAFGNGAEDFKYLQGGSVESSDADDFWSNVYTIGTQTAGTVIYLIQNDTEVPAWWIDGNIDILVQVKSGGAWIQSVNTAGVLTNGGIWLYAREFQDLYDHAFVDISGGTTPAGVNTSVDSANQTASGTVATYSDISITFGTISRDLNNGNGAVNYDVEIDCAGRPMTEVYEYLKYVTSYDFDIPLNGDDGKEYRSANEGTYSEIKVAPFGTIAGGTLFAARGVWLTNYSAAEFVLIDASGTTQSPPNYQKVTVNHPDLAGQESSDGSVTVFVAEVSGGNVIKNQYTIDSVTANTIVATAPVDINKVPQSGVVRIGDARYDYTGYSGSTFTGVTPDPTGETGDFYVPLLDLEAADIVAVTTKQSDNVIYSGDIPVRTVVRRYGSKPYTADTTFGSAGLTFSPIITDDPQAT